MKLYHSRTPRNSCMAQLVANWYELFGWIKYYKAIQMRQTIRVSCWKQYHKITIWIENVGGWRKKEKKKQHRTHFNQGAERIITVHIGCLSQQPFCSTCKIIRKIEFDGNFLFSLILVIQLCEHSVGVCTPHGGNVYDEIQINQNTKYGECVCVCSPSEFTSNNCSIASLGRRIYTLTVSESKRVRSFLIVLCFIIIIIVVVNFAITIFVAYCW